MPKTLPPTPHSLAELFESCCQGKPQELAYAFVRDTLELERQLTYGELEHTVRSLAGYLARRARPGTRVLLLYPPGLDVVCAFWACMCAGLVAVPAPAPDPVRQKHSLPRLRAIIEDAQVALVLTTSSIETVSSELSINKDGSQIKWMATDQPYDQADAVELPHLKETALAYLQYTSGSTATPRGVMISHGNVLSHCKALSLAGGVSDRSRSLCWLPYFHDYGLLHGIIAPFYAGIPAYLMSPVTFLRRPLRWLEAVSRFAITHSGGPNFSYESCLRAVRQQPEWQADLSAWTVASCGAEPIHADTVEQFIETFGPQGFRRTSFAPAYGLAEATLVVTMKRTEAEPTFLKVEAEALADSIVKESCSSERGTRTLVGCGEPLEETRVLIVNPTTQRPCQASEVGEVWLAGAGIATGYWGRQEESDATFKATIAGSGEGPYLRTGDLGFIYRGELFLTGRLKDLIIVRGRNYYPHDLEWTAEQSHPGLRRGCGAAFSIENQTGERVVLVYEIEKKLPESDMAEVMRCVRRALADEYELEVHHVVLVKSGTIPITSSGKIQRYACKAYFESGQLAVAGTSTLGTDEEEQNVEPLSEIPRTQVEIQLADIWQEVLGGPQPRRHENFFALGGNSLLATQVVSRVEEMFLVDFPLRTIFDSPTIAQLAEYIRIEQRRQVGNASLPPIVAVSRTEPLPLSYSQQRMWFMYQLAPDGMAYNMPTALSMRGRLDRSALAHAVEGLVRRHESFHTTFAMTTEGPVQIIGQPQVRHWEEFDLRLLPEANRLQEATRLIAQDAGRPFDLVKGPLARFALIQIGDNEHIFFLNMHHIIGDQWSFAIIGRECAALYNDFCEGQTAIPEPSALQYADFAVWQRQWLNTEVLQNLLTYWRTRLVGLQVLAVPTDYPRPQAQRYAGSYRAIDLTDSLLANLTRLSVQRGSTLFMTLLAAFQILLGRYAGQTDVAIGVPIANRTHLSTEGIVGTFVNTLVMRTDLSGNPTFTEVLRRVREVALSAYDHQDLPFERLVEELSTKRDLSYSPLVQVLFNVANAPMDKTQFHGLTWAPFEFDGGAAQFDLTMAVDAELTKKAHLSFRTDLFDGSTIERMAVQYKTLLEAVAADPQKNIADYQILSQSDRHLILHQWNKTHAGYPHVKALPQLIADQAASTPDSIALSMDGRTLTYGALNAQANRLARYLRRLGVGRGGLVGICLERSPMMVAGLLGILKAGAGYVPLDPDYPLDRLGFMVEDSGSRVIVTSSALLDRIPHEGRHAVCIDRERDAIDQEASTALEHPDPDDVAYVMYTSGSTGKPKGVEITHQSLVNFLWSMRNILGCTSRDVLLSVTTLSFDIAGLELYLPLIVGGRVELASHQVALDGRLLRRRLEEVCPSIMQATPATWHMLIDAGWEPTPHLTALCGGEALPRELADQILARAGSLWNMYGPTETTIWSTLSKIEQGLMEITIGRPIANTQLYILDDSLQPVPIGVPGELYIGGDGVANGYRHRPELTAERFILHPFSDRPGARLYKTGDLARYRSDGRVVHLGRLDHQVKIRGFRIEIGEIEAALSRHPAVRQVVVTAREDQHGLKQLAAYLVCQNETASTPTELRALLRKALPEYMMPSYFVFLDALPLTANHKVDVKALPAPAVSGVSSDKIHVGPRNGLEVQLAALWQQVLGVHDPDVYDNFFDLGGHSLKAAQLFYLLEQVYGRQLPLATLFQAPTIAALASVLLREQWTPPWQSLVAIQPSGTAAPIFMVPGVGGNVLIFAQLARLLGPDQPFYGLQARGLDGKEAPFISVPEMARHFVNEIQQLRPQGPYVIAGACTGGLIAYEIAQQLKAQGKGVTLLLMDTWHPSSYRKQPSMGLMGLWFPLMVVWETVRAFLRTSPKDRAPFLQIKAKRLMTFLQGGTTEDEKRMEEAWETGMQVERVTTATFHAVAHYEVQRYPGTLLNCIASERVVMDGIRDTRHEWPQLAENGSDTVSIVAGDSGRLFVSPHVEDLAGHIQRYVAKASDPAMTSDLPSARVNES